MAGGGININHDTENISGTVGSITIDGVLPGGVKTNLAATVNPGATDDSNSNYAVGSLWVNITLDIVFRCVDATVGAAIWKQMAYLSDIPPHPLAFITG